MSGPSKGLRPVRAGLCCLDPCEQDGDGGDSRISSVPSARVWAHRTVIALRLSSFALDQASASKQFEVLVERGELEVHRRWRIMLSRGLGPKEYELLGILS